MNTPDKLSYIRLWLGNPTVDGNPIDMLRDAVNMLHAIEVLHQPRVIVYRPNDDHDIICSECDKPWPCETHRLLHPGWV
jgi:hypothetical protein